MFLEQNLKFEIECKQVSKRSSYLRLHALLTFFQVRYPTCRLLQRLVSLVQGALEIGVTFRFFRNRTVDKFHFDLAASKSKPGTVTGSPLPATSDSCFFLFHSQLALKVTLGLIQLLDLWHALLHGAPEWRYLTGARSRLKNDNRLTGGRWRRNSDAVLTLTRFSAFPRAVFPHTQEQPVFKTSVWIIYWDQKKKTFSFVHMRL